MTLGPTESSDSNLVKHVQQVNASFCEILISDNRDFLLSFQYNLTTDSDNDKMVMTRMHSSRMHTARLLNVHDFVATTECRNCG